jgi:hypothetical protein
MLVDFKNNNYLIFCFNYKLYIILYTIILYQYDY